jgi:hypothetical protein
MMTRLALIISLLLLLPLAACERAAELAPGFLTDDREVMPATAEQADSLAAEGARVSITGTVVEQDGDGLLLVDDGTGLIHIEIPEDMPLLTGHRLLASGVLTERDGAPFLEATEWLYDSTAVPVHSQ